MIDEKLIKSEKKYRYFIFKKDHRFGLKYDSLDAKNGTSFPVDSFLNRKAFKGARFYQEGNDSLVKTAWNNDRSILTEHHINKTKFDESYCDTLIFTFMKSLNKIDFSFSREYDSIKGMKLSKIRLITNPIPKGKYAFDVPRRELLFEISESPVIARDRIDFIGRHKKEVGKMGK